MTPMMLTMLPRPLVWRASKAIHCHLGNNHADTCRDKSVSLDALSFKARPAARPQKCVTASLTAIEATVRGTMGRSRRRTVSAALPRYGQLLTADERDALRRFEHPSCKWSCAVIRATALRDVPGCCLCARSSSLRDFFAESGRSGWPWRAWESGAEAACRCTESHQALC